MCLRNTERVDSESVELTRRSACAASRLRWTAACPHKRGSPLPRARSEPADRHGSFPISESPDRPSTSARRAKKRSEYRFCFFPFLQIVSMRGHIASRRSADSRPTGGSPEDWHRKSQRPATKPASHQLPRDQAGEKAFLPG